MSPPSRTAIVIHWAGGCTRYMDVVDRYNEGNKRIAKYVQLLRRVEEGEGGSNRFVEKAHGVRWRWG